MPPRRSNYRKSSLRFPDQSGTELVRLFAVLWELHVPVSLLLHRVKERGDILRIVTELERIGDKHRLAGPEDPGHRHLGQLRIAVKAHLLYHLILCPGCVDEPGPDLPAEECSPLFIVDRVLEHQPFEEAPGLAGRNCVVNGGTNEDCIRGPDFFKDRMEIVLYGTVPIALSPDPLAGKAAGAALVVQVVEMDEFGFSPFGFCAFERMFKERCGVPLFPGTAVECDEFHKRALED